MDNEMYDCRWIGCSMLFDDPEVLYCHLKEDHIGRKATRNLYLNCDWERCTFTANTRVGITSHLLVHIPFRPFICKFCSKAIKRAHDLKRHEEIHTEPRISRRRRRRGASHRPQQQQQLAHQIPAHPSSTHDNFQNSIMPLRSEVPEQISVTQIMHDDFNLEHILNDILFPTNIDTESAEYRQEATRTLERIQHELDSGTIAQSDFGLNIRNEQQLASTNRAMALLFNSIATGQNSQEPNVNLDQRITDHGLLHNAVTDFLLNQLQEEDYHQNPMDTLCFNTMHPISSEETDMFVQPIPNQAIYEYENDFSILSDFDVSLADQHETKALDNWSTLGDVDILKENKRDSEEMDKDEAGSLKTSKDVTYQYKEDFMDLIEIIPCCCSLESLEYSKEIDTDEVDFFKPSKSITYQYKKELMSVNFLDFCETDSEELVTDSLSETTTLSNDNRFQSESLSHLLILNASLADNNHLLLLEKIKGWINENYRKHHPVPAETSISDCNSSCSLLDQ